MLLNKGAKIACEEIDGISSIYRTILNPNKAELKKSVRLTIIEVLNEKISVFEKIPSNTIFLSEKYKMFIEQNMQDHGN